MKKPFRNFTGRGLPENVVHLEGCVTSRRLYKISVEMGFFPQESVSLEDMLIEFRATCDVIAKKYGVSYKVERNVEANTHEAKFVIGKVRISLKLLDCMVPHGYLLSLEATNEEIEQESKKEVKDSLRVAGDGMDAL